MPRDKIERAVRTLQVDGLRDIGEEGRFTAGVGQLNEIGRNNIIYAPGLLGGREWTVPVLVGHNWGMIPVGKAVIKETDAEIVAEGRINLDTSHGRDFHAALRFDLEEGPPLTEWSLGFFEVETDTREDGVEIFKEIEPIEVSAVLRGGAAGTRLIRVQRAVGRHKTETSDAPWSVSTAVGRLPSPVPLDVARAVYAWIDEARIEDGSIPKGACKLPHHFVDRGGKPGAASTRACIAAIAALNGARGGVDIPEAERKAVYAHLAGHLHDAGIEPPELQDADAGIRLADEVRLALWEMEALVEKLRRISAARAQSGGHVGAETLRAFGEIAPLVEELGSIVARMAAAADVGERAYKALARWKALEARLQGLR